MPPRGWERAFARPLPDRGGGPASIAATVDVRLKPLMALGRSAVSAPPRYPPPAPRSIAVFPPLSSLTRIIRVLVIIL